MRARDREPSVTPYADLERTALRELALATLTNPKAPIEHRVAARNALISAGQKLDLDRLSASEASTLEILVAKAYGA